MFRSGTHPLTVLQPPRWLSRIPYHTALNRVLRSTFRRGMNPSLTVLPPPRWPSRHTALGRMPPLPFRSGLYPSPL
ncbi:hypothetical protein JB92DRAFT_3006466 [Gautieria morchelliformis]|nr:hypothetical protein JB92DRAFT_3006466 [Gautieria morchelliformis]